MNILPFPGTVTANTRTLPFLLTPKKPASTAALEAAIAATKAEPPIITAPLLTRKDGQTALTWLQENNFIGKPQAAFVKDLIRTSEEWEFFAAKMVEIRDMIEAMPHTYQQDGKGDDAIAYLHYFGGSYDAYITEKDMGSPDDTPAERQWQAYGTANIGMGFSGGGYICLPEILATGRIELDFHFTPTTLRKIKGIPDEPAEPEPSERPASDGEPSPDPQSAHLMGASQLQTADPDIGETLAILQQQYIEAEAAAPGAGWKPGAVLVETWGWEQTNKDFYQIAERKGDWLTLIPIEAIQTREKDYPGGTDAMSGTSMPTSPPDNAKPFRRKLAISNGRTIAKIKHGYLKLWNGTPEAWTDYA